MVEALELLTPESFGLGSKPTIERIECEKIVDHLGDPALDVLVVLADSNSEEAMAHDVLRGVKDAIFGKLSDQYHGERYPYIRFVLAWELAELARQQAADDEEPEEGEE